MRTYSDIQDDHVRAVLQAVENAESDLNRAKTNRQGHETSRKRLDESLQEVLRKHRGLDSPQSALKTEIDDLEGRVRDLQRQVDGKRQQLKQLQLQADDLAKEVRKNRDDIAAAEGVLRSAVEDVVLKEKAVGDARQRLLEARLRALATYCAETFGSLLRTATEATARERFEKQRQAFEEARTTDRQVMAAHEERIELRRLLETSQVPSLRDLLAQRLQAVEQVLSSRFPGFLDGPPPPDDEELVETFFWYDHEEDLTRLLLPVPASCWHTPPGDDQDPRGKLLCQALWAFVQPLGDPVPTVDCERDLVVLEFHGDHSARIADALFELRLSAGRKVTFLPAPLPAELKEALL
jgi:hypothetical protein